MLQQVSPWYLFSSQKPSHFPLSVSLISSKPLISSSFSGSHPCPLLLNEVFSIVPTSQPVPTPSPQPSPARPWNIPYFTLTLVGPGSPQILLSGFHPWLTCSRKLLRGGLPVCVCVCVYLRWDTISCHSLGRRGSHICISPHWISPFCRDIFFFFSRPDPYMPASI